MSCSSILYEIIPTWPNELCNLVASYVRDPVIRLIGTIPSRSYDADIDGRLQLAFNNRPEFYYKNSIYQQNRIIDVKKDSFNCCMLEIKDVKDLKNTTISDTRTLLYVLDGNRYITTDNYIRFYLNDKMIFQQQYPDNSLRHKTATLVVDNNLAINTQNGTIVVNLLNGSITYYKNPWDDISNEDTHLYAINSNFIKLSHNNIFIPKTAQLYPIPFSESIDILDGITFPCDDGDFDSVATINDVVFPNLIIIKSIENCSYIFDLNTRRIIRTIDCIDCVSHGSEIIYFIQTDGINAILSDKPDEMPANHIKEGLTYSEFLPLINIDNDNHSDKKNKPTLEPHYRDCDFYKMKDGTIYIVDIKQKLSFALANSSSQPSLDGMIVGELDNGVIVTYKNNKLLLWG